MRSTRGFYPIALVVLSVLLAGTMWVVPYLPTNDGPEWIFATHAENHYADPDAPYASAYIPAPQFASRGLSVFYGPFEAWLGWQRGLQVALSLIALFAAWGFFALARALHPDRRAMGLLGFPLALSWSFYMGFWSFVVSTALGYFILALAVRLREPTWKGRGVLAVLLLVQAVAHVFGAVLTGGALVALGLARARRGERLKELARIAVTGSLAASVLAASVLVSRNLVLAPFARDVGRLPWSNAIAALPGTIAPGPASRAIVVSLAVLGAAVVATARASRPVTDAADRGLGVVAVALLLTGVLAPFQIPGWQAFSERFVPLGVGLALAVVPIERAPSPSRRVAPAAMLVVSVVWLALTYPFHRRVTQLCPDAIAGLFASVPIHGKILPISLGPTELDFFNRTAAEVPLMDPLVHMGSLYATAHGGTPLDSFAGNAAVHPFLKRPDANRRPEPDFVHYWKAINSFEFHHDARVRHAIDDQLAAFGVFYDEVAVFGARPDDLAVWHDRGFVADWEARTVLVAHFEPCTIDFTVPAAESDPPPVFDVGVGEIWLLTDARVPAVVMSDGRAHFELTPAPCGRVHVRARWGTTHCRNANADGDVVARITRDAHLAVCEGR